MNEKYIAYTRVLSELIIVVDESTAEYDTESNKNQEANTNKKSVNHMTDSGRVTAEYFPYPPGIGASWR